MSAIEDAKSAVQGALAKGGSAGPLQLLGGIRLGIGVAYVVVPGITGRLLGLKPGRNPQLNYVSRVAGATNAAIGAALLAGPPEGRPALVQVGLAGDVLSLLATRMAKKKGSIGFRAASVSYLLDLGTAGLSAAVVSGKS
ncbi:MAG TPA: hypothetical protein VHW26_06120 [Solirubrobacteraceae bacterium]|nr:hypothetical protein [Solirubrobacteraceae bacterium]